MAKQSKAQRETVGRVMHEFKHGELESSTGGQVENPKQALAIALSEAGTSKNQDERKGRTAQAETDEKIRKRHDGSLSKAELYDQAKAKGIQGRSQMNKDQLRQALGH